MYEKKLLEINRKILEIMNRWNGSREKGLNAYHDEIDCLDHAKQSGILR